MKTRITFLFLAIAMGVVRLVANPAGGTVASGIAHIGDPANSTLTVTQGSNHAIINWRDFSINAGEITRFVQPDSASAVLNRVTGGNPSALLGKLEANGSVYLINPNGVLVGPNGIIQTGGSFIASTRDLSDAAFLAAGDLRFQGDSSGGVENLGFIKSDSGDIILVGRTVKNAGVIEAEEGAVGLAAGDDVLLSATGKDRLSVRVTLAAAPAEIGVDNAGTVKAAQAQLTAAGGDVYALAVNNGGVIEATGFARLADGRIVLSSEGGNIAVAGRLTAHDADGSGGTIMVGGGYQGTDAAVPNAQNTAIAASATLDANATAGHADGGRVIVWSDGATDFAGKITARGGTTGGNGGFAEVSGKHDLYYRGAADLRAPSGATGTLLLDPGDITVDVTSLAVGSGPNQLTMSDLSQQLQSSNVTVSTSSLAGSDPGDITFIGAVSGQFNFPHALTFSADRDIIFNAPLIIAATNDQGAITFNAGRNITANQPLLFSATSTGGAASGTTAGTTGTDFNVGAITFNATGNLQFNQPLTLNIASTGGAGSAGTGANGAAGGRGGNITTGGLTLWAGIDVFINNDLSVLATSQGGAGGTGSGLTAGSFSGGIGGAGGTLDLGTVRLNPDGRAVFSLNGGGNSVYVKYDLRSLGGRGGDEIGGQAGGAGGTITTSGLQVRPAGQIVMYGTSEVNIGARSVGGAGGNITLSDVGSGSAAGTGGAGGTVAVGTTDLVAGTSINLQGEAISLEAAITGGAAGINTATSSAQRGGNGGAAGNVTLGSLNLTAGTTISNTGKLIRSMASATPGADPSPPAFGGTPGTAAPGNVSTGQINLTAGDNIWLGIAGGSRGVIYSDKSIHVIAGDAFLAGGGALSTQGALFLVIDNDNPANPNFENISLDLTGTLIQAGPGATQPTFNTGTSTWNGSHIADYIRFYTVDRALNTLPAGFTPPNDITSANNYYNVGAFAGLTPGIFYKNVIPHDPLTVTADSFAKLYGAALPTFTATYSGFVNGDDISDFTLPTFTTAATMGSNAGTYAITPGGMTGPANYSFNYVAGTLTINPAALTITAADASKLYGAALPTFSASVSGLVNGDTESAVVTLAPSTTATAGSNAGTYVITPGATLNSSNYTLGTQNNGTLTITPVTLTVSAGDTSRDYGAANPTFSTTVTGLVNGDTESAVVTLAPSTTALAGANVGTYSITPGATLGTTNYTLSQVNGTLTINPATLNVAANNASATYGAALPTLTGSALNLVNSDVQSTVVNFAPTTTATAGANVGTYTIMPNPSLLGSVPNYALGTITNGTLTINPAVLNVTAADASKVYGAAMPVLTGTASGLVNGDAQSTVVSFAPTTSATAGSNAGTYTITPNASLLTTNYTLGTSTPGVFTITRAPLVITADNLSRLYGQPNPALTATYTGLVNGDTSAAVSGLTLATTATTGSATGNYPVINSGALSAANYLITFNPGTLTVGDPAPLTITADNYTLGYGFAALPAFTATATGLINSDPVSVITGLQFATTATVGANVGNYSIVPSGASAPAYYTVSYVNGTLAVTPALLNVAANNASKVYGAALPGLGGTATGLVNGDAQDAVVSFAPTTTATAGANVGTYAITPHASLLSSNYTLGTQSNGTLTVTPAVLNITADNTSKVYGAALPVFTGTISGLVNGDVATDVFSLGFSTTATAGSNVGSYSLTPSASLFGLTPNYTLGAPNPGTLTITRAPLTITADSFSRALSETNPVFKASYNGLVNGDTAAVVAGLSFITAANAGSPAGSYAITPAGASAANYAIHYVDGTLIVRGLLGLTLTAANATRIYGDPNPEFSLASIAGLLDGDTLASVQFRTDATLGSNVGSYAITPYNAVVTTAVPREYDISYLPGTLTINPAVLTVALNGATLHHSARNWQPISGMESVTTTADSLTASTRYLVNGGGSDSFGYTISGFKFAGDVAGLDRNFVPGFGYGELTTTTQLPIYDAATGALVGYAPMTTDHGSGPVMNQGGLRLTGAAAGNYTFAMQEYSPSIFGYVPNTALTITTLTTNAYPDSKLILPAIMLYDPTVTFFDADRGKAALAGSDFTGDGTNYYNQAQLAGLAPGYETNWTPGSPVGTYWTLPTLAGLNAGINNPVATVSYDLNEPFYFADLANPGREFAVTKVRVGLVNVFTRDNVPESLTGIKLLQEKHAGTVYAAEIDVGPIGAFGVPIAAQDVLYDIVDRMLADAQIDVGSNRVQGVAQWILANGNNPQMRAALTAYMAQEAVDIVTSGQPRTAAQQVFLDALTNQVNQNRAVAANEALAAYNQWKADAAVFRENMKGYGALLNFGDRIPPEILALAAAQVPSEQILKVSGAVTGVVSAGGGAVMGAVLQSKDLMLQLMPYAGRIATQSTSGALSIVSGGAGAAPIANIVTTLATLGMAIERIVSSESDQKAFNEAIERLSQPTNIENVLGRQAVIGGASFGPPSDAPSYTDQHGTEWTFTRTQNNLALMAAITATLSDSAGSSFTNSSLGNRQ